MARRVTTHRTFLQDLPWPTTNPILLAGWTDVSNPIARNRFRYILTDPPFAATQEPSRPFGNFFSHDRPTLGVFLADRTKFLIVMVSHLLTWGVRMTDGLVVAHTGGS